MDFFEKGEVYIRKYNTNSQALLWVLFTNSGVVVMAGYTPETPRPTKIVTFLKPLCSKMKKVGVVSCKTKI